MIRQDDQIKSLQRKLLDQYKHLLLPIDKNEDSQGLRSTSDFSLRPFKFTSKIEKESDDGVTRPRRRSIDAL